MSEDIQKFCDLLCRQLRGCNVDAFADSSGVRLRKWPTVLIEVNSIEAKQCTGADDGECVRVALSFHWHKTKPAIFSEVFGIEADYQRASADAAWQWVHGVAPLFISFLSDEMCLGTEWWPNGTEIGIDGWETLAGPWLLRGDPELKEQTTILLERTHLSRFLRKEILAALDRDHDYELLSLYVARTGGEVFSEARIGPSYPENIEQALRGLPLPEPEKPGSFISVRRVLLCMNTRSTEE
jgi:hypothetical protein